MALSNRDRLSKLIDAADVSVRAASQLRILAKGRPVRDRESLEKVRQIIEQAIAGGRFMSNGTTTGLSASLLPLTWTVDVRASVTGDTSYDTQDPYAELVQYLSHLSRILQDAESGAIQNAVNTTDAADFLQRLGDSVGGQADQEMTGVSRPTTALSS